nr:hypothetical protein [uncultured Pseudomonas sp.]
MNEKETPTAWKVTRAVVTSKAFWKLAATVALLAGLTVPEGLLELLGELVREVLAETVATALVVPFEVAGMMASL